MKIRLVNGTNLRVLNKIGVCQSIWFRSVDNTLLAKYSNCLWQSGLDWIIKAIVPSEYFVLKEEFHNRWLSLISRRDATWLQMPYKAITFRLIEENYWLFFVHILHLSFWLYVHCCAAVRRALVHLLSNRCFCLLQNLEEWKAYPRRPKVEKLKAPFSSSMWKKTVT